MQAGFSFVPLLRSRARLAMLATGSVLCCAAAVQAQTGVCVDGTTTNAKSKTGACSRHGGVKTWNGPDSATAAPAATVPITATPTPKQKKIASTPAASPAPAPAPPRAAPPLPASRPAAAPTAASAPAPAPTRPLPPQTRTPATAPAQGGGPGLVWVNVPTKVYHCPGSEFYGKTKDGKYMSESDAISMGARGDRNKTCPK